MVRGTEENPTIQVVVFESTIANGQSLSGGPVGHVAGGVQNRTYSWDDTGYERESNTPFDQYLDRNFQFRNGTVTELDFGSAANNRAAAEEIMLGPRNGSSHPYFQSGYNLISNNCGETLCRISERLGLPRDNTIAPFQHLNYINTTLRPFIVNQQRFGPIFNPPHNEPCRFDRRYC